MTLNKSLLEMLPTYLIDDFDFLIGYTAIENDIILVTNNTKHFKRMNSIQLEDWKATTGIASYYNIFQKCYD